MPLAAGIALGGHKRPQIGALGVLVAVVAGRSQVVQGTDRRLWTGRADPARVEALLDDYMRRFYEDFWTTQPLPDRATS